MALVWPSFISFYDLSLPYINKVVELKFLRAVLEKVFSCKAAQQSEKHQLAFKRGKGHAPPEIVQFLKYKYCIYIVQSVLRL